MIKYLIAIVSFLCITHVMYADDFGSKLYNWLINGVDIPFISWTRDVSLSDNDSAQYISYPKSVVTEANPICFARTEIEVGKKKYKSLNCAKRIFPCIKQMPVKVRARSGNHDNDYVMVKGIKRRKADFVMTYKFMPLDFLLIASLSCGAYWLYKNKTHVSIAHE